MFRAGLVLLIVTVAGAVQPALAGCIGEDKDHVILSRQAVTLTGDRYPGTFPAVIRQLVGDLEGIRDGLDRFEIKAVEVSVFGDGYPCGAPLIDVTDDHYGSARVDVLNFTWFHGIDIVSEFYGASGSSFRHRLFVRTGMKFVEVTPPGEMTHTNMGGFFFGPLNQERGNGFVLWEADWHDSGAHYDPHPYKGTFYRWDGAAFQSAGEIKNPKRYEITNRAPDFLGLPKGTAFDETMPYANFAIFRDSAP